MRWPGKTLLVMFSISTAITAAGARNTFHDLSVSEAVKSEIGRSQLQDLPFFMAGQTHPAVERDLGVFKSNRRTNAFNKSDEEACRIAFLSAIIALQKKAIDRGGGAVVDIKSVTNNNNLESATKYRCVAGNVVANGALTGRVVKISR